MLAILLSWVALAITGRKLYLQVEKARKYRLGFDGERYVAEELSRLIAHQYEIFHDVPFEGFNVDHVLVGPQGVFAIETKTRRKPRSAGSTEGTGKIRRLLSQMAMGPAYGLQQASNNAPFHNGFLVPRCRSVFVLPILTLPGWWVDRALTFGCIEIKKDVPEDELDDTLQDYRDAGTEVETTRRDDGSCTVNATIPGKERARKIAEHGIPPAWRS